MHTRRASCWENMMYGSLAAWLTALCAFKVLWWSMCRQLSRERVDNMLRAWAKRMFAVVRAHYQVHFETPLVLEPGKRYIIMCNHTSHFDIPMVYAALPGSIRMLAKKELFSIPFFGAAMRRAEFVSIDRGNRDQARADLDQAKQRMAAGIVLWVAPEGTRSQDGRLLPFKQGGFHLAIHTGALIIPVGIRGLHELLPAKKLWLTLGQQVSVRVGASIDASAYSIAERRQLMAVVAQKITELSSS